MTANDHHCLVSLGGSPIPSHVVVRVTVDQRLMRPARLTVELRDAISTGTWVEGALGEAKVRVGADVVVHAVSSSGKLPLFKGTITAITGESSPLGRSVRFEAYDKLHKLTAGTATKVWSNIKASDVISEKLKTAGLQVKVEATRAVHDHLWQVNESDYDFIVRLAAEAGRVITVDATGNAQVRRLIDASKGPKARHSLEATPGPFEATADVNVITWRARSTAAEEVKSVTVKGWQADKRAGTARQRAVGKATVNGFKPTPPPKATLTEIRADDTVAVLRERAQTLTDAIAEPRTELQMQMLGSPKIAAGEILSFGRVGKPFDGTYVVSHAVHDFGPQGYITEVDCGVLGDHSMLGSFARRPAAPTSGPVNAIVTSTNDPQKRRRVKLKYPWLEDRMESDWAPVVSHGAGNDRGLAILPDVHDEVLVVFTHGDFNHPVVVGGLFNKKDTPPTPGHVGGQPERQTWVSRKGNRITLVDQRGQEAIEIVNHDNKVKILIDKAGVVTVSTMMTDINLKAGGGGNLTLEGNNVSIKARAALKATGTATAELSASGPTVVKGAVVKIN